MPEWPSPLTVFVSNIIIIARGDDLGPGYNNIIIIAI